MSLHLRIAGTGKYLPNEIIDNRFFEQRDLFVYGTGGVRKPSYVAPNRITSNKIIEMSGIKERRRSKENESPSDLGYFAALDAIKDAAVPLESIVGLIFATITEKQNVPSAACKVQERLGLTNCFAYDINNACSGFIESLASANARVARRRGNYLVIAGECLTKIVDYSDVNSYLFGDGAGAAVLVPSENNLGILAEHSISEPGQGNLDSIISDKSGNLRMPNGGRVMKKAVGNMIGSVTKLKDELGWDKADVYIPHQANKRIIDSVAESLAKEGAKVYSNIERYGNTSAATCAIALHEAIKDGTITSGKRVIMTSFGAGFVTASVAMQF